MKLNSSKLFFITFMIVGVMLCLSSNNWIMIWCGLEITLVSFLPIMVSNSMNASESTMKYFMIQSISSAMLMLGLIMMLSKINMGEKSITIAILLKMGIAPMHNWVLSIIEGMKFESVLILLTILKLPPIMITSYLSSKLLMIIMTTMIMGSMMGLNQNSTRKMIVYSSIFNLGLLLSVIKANNFWMSFWFMYSVLIWVLIKYMSELKTNYVNQMMINDKSLIKNVNLWFLLMSMGGLPPFMGFLMKLMVIEFLMLTNMYLVMVILITCSLIVMFFYTRMMFLIMMFFSLKSKLMMYNQSFINSSLMIINLMIIPVMLTIKSLY
nr:NADH dehydrogenase subunit 2 [Dikraneurini sp. SL-2021a]